MYFGGKMIPVKDGLYNGVLRVLLLEDSETDAELIMFALQDAIPGLLLKRVETCDDFVRAIKEFSPQVVLSDYVVPGFDGLSALKLIRKSYPDLPFLFVSGALGEELAVDLLRAGATDYVLKDRMSRLPSAIFRSLEEFREKQMLAQRTIELQEMTRELAEEVEVRRQTERELLNSQKDLRRLALELSRAEDRELRRIALEVHEHIGQNLVLVLMNLEHLKNEIRNQLDLEHSIKLLGSTIEEVRSLALELSPPVLYEFGIFAALDWLVERLQAKESIPIVLEIGKRQPLPPQDLQVFIYKSALELIRNALRHADPKNLRILCGIEPEGIYAEVQDDGSGFDPSVLEIGEEKQSGFGLYSIRERLAHLGGRLSIESGSRSGSRLRISLPANLPS